MRPLFLVCFVVGVSGDARGVSLIRDTFLFSPTMLQITPPLDRRCYFLIHGDTLDTDQLPALLSASPFQRAMEVFRVLTPEEIERERYESRLKKQRDDKWLLYAAREDGREEGRKQGALIQSIQMCQRILKLPLTAQDELLKLTPAELAAMADTMEKQALVPAEVR
jgi:hypothetical protein